MHSYETRANEQERRALSETVTTLRGLIKQVNSCHVPADLLVSVNETLGGALGRLKEASAPNERAMAYYDMRYDGALNNLQPYSPFMGEFNPLSPPMDCCYDGATALGKVVFSVAYEGPPNSCHGGIIAGVYDQLLALPGLQVDKAGPTAYLHIEYRQHTPLQREIDFSAWIDRIEGKKIFVKGESHCDGVLLSEANALFINQLS